MAKLKLKANVVCKLDYLCPECGGTPRLDSEYDGSSGIEFHRVVCGDCNVQGYRYPSAVIAMRDFLKYRGIPKPAEFAA